VTNERPPGSRRRLPAWLHHWGVTRPHGKASHHILTAATALLGLVVGIGAIWHPFAFWYLGLVINFHRSDLPPLLGIDFLALPAVLVGMAAWRAWWALSLDLEAWKQRRRRRKANPSRTPGRTDQRRPPH
jgi:hypothetical protein